MFEVIDLNKIDPEVCEAVNSEIVREKQNLLMIASENYASPAVMQAQANVMTNKYAEGYPGARYYGGCKYVDMVENLAIDRAKTLFHAEHVNVQPHSGSQANMAVYLSFMKPGDRILGMDLSHGGHLTHGSPVSFSGKVFQAVSYGLDKKTERIDYDRIRDLAKKHQPHVVVAGASAYPRTIDFKLFREIADECNAALMVDMAHIAGLVATGHHPSPVGLADYITTTTHKTLRGPRGGLILTKKKFAGAVDKAVFPGIQGGPLMHVIAAKAVAFKEALAPEFSLYQKQVIANAAALAEALMGYGFDLVSGGTDNHLILVNLTGRKMSGKDSETALGRAGIVVNKNAVPFDQRGPKTTSGIRLGTPGLTTRGMQENDMRVIAKMIQKVLENPASEAVLNKVKEDVLELCNHFPIYRNLEEGH